MTDKNIRFDHADLDIWEICAIELALRDWAEKPDVSELAKEHARDLVNRILLSQRVIVVTVKKED